MHWGYANRNVATLSRSPKVPRIEGRTLTPEQARDFIGVLQGHRNEALYALMFSTGPRRGEALGLKWTDLDEYAGVLRVTSQLHRAKAGLVLMDRVESPECESSSSNDGSFEISAKASKG
jgi:integrase